MMKNNERMTRWLLDAIDTEIAKPDGEADMALVEECTALLEELNGASCTLTERELTKRCKAITRGKAGGKSAKKRVRLAAAIAACLAVFVFVCGCGYLPSINVILQTLFASGVGKDVEVHEVTYTFQGMSTQYDDIDNLLNNEKLEIYLPKVLPKDTYITNILKGEDQKEICIIFNNPSITLQISSKEGFIDYTNTKNYEKHETENGILYIRKISETSFIGLSELNGYIYNIQYSDMDMLVEIFESMR